MPISGSDHAITPDRANQLRAGAGRSGWPVLQGVLVPLYALSNVARAGGTRSNYHSPKLFVAINGVQRATAGSDLSTRVLYEGLSITDIRDATVNRSQFTMIGVPPTVGQDVVMTLGSMNNRRRLFAGTVLQVDQTYVGKPANARFQINAVDYVWRLDHRLLSARFTNATVATIAAALITYSPGFTLEVAVDIAADIVDDITFTNQSPSSAWTQFTKRLGLTWKVDYHKVLRLYDTDSVETPPTILNAVHRSLSGFQFQRDLSQVVTRVYVEGGGGEAFGDVAIGETILPITVSSWYQSTGGIVRCGPQRLTYTAVVAGGGGTLVGPGAAPSAAPAALAAAGSGIASGAHDYAVTFVTGAGESLPGPRVSVTTGVVAAPSSAPAGALANNGSVTAGDHAYAVTFVTAAGETTPGPSSGTVTTGTVTTAAPSDILQSYSAGPSGGSLITLDYYFYVVTFVTATGETTRSPKWGEDGALTNYGRQQGGAGKKLHVSNIPTGPAEVTSRKLYRSSAVGYSATTGLPLSNPADSDYKLVTTIADNTTTSYDDGMADASRTSALPSSNTATIDKKTVALTGIATGPSGVTSRKLYRTAAGGSQLKLLTTLADNATTTYTDTTADGSLGANVPTSNTAAGNQVALSSIPIGASSVTSRKVYRTAVGSSQLKLVTTVADNTTTTYTDSTADGSLGANVPTSDASGLTQPSGVVNAGSIALLVAGTGAFAASGGWAVIGNGQQCIRYTGFSGSSLTGIPASGPGAIVASISYNSTVTAAPELIGIPASGAGSIQYAIRKGDTVNLVVQVDDVAAQTALAALLNDGSDGIIEDTISDGRIGYTEAAARGAATIELRNTVDIRPQWQSRDINTGAGKTAGVNLGPPISLLQDFTIQQVTISNFQPAIMPTYAAQAARTRFSLEDLLRLARLATKDT